VSVTKRKPSEQRERRYIVEFVNSHFPSALWRGFNVPVTPISDEMRKRYPDVSSRYFTRFRKYADAIVVTDDEVLILEAKLRHPIEALGQLLVYVYWSYQVPELRRFRPRKHVGAIVAPLDDQFLRIPMEQAGFRLYIFKPKWAMDYLREKGFAI